MADQLDFKKVCVVKIGYRVEYTACYALIALNQRTVYVHEEAKSAKSAPFQKKIDESDIHLSTVNPLLSQITEGAICLNTCNVSLLQQYYTPDHQQWTASTRVIALAKKP